MNILFNLSYNVISFITIFNFERLYICLKYVSQCYFPYSKSQTTLFPLQQNSLFVSSQTTIFPLKQNSQFVYLFDKSDIFFFTYSKIIKSIKRQTTISLTVKIESFKDKDLFSNTYSLQNSEPLLSQLV